TNTYFSQLIQLEGGGFYFWNNATHAFQNLVDNDYVRSNTLTYPVTSTPDGWGACSATPISGVAGPSVWDQNLGGQSGGPCVDQTGRGTGDYVKGDFHNSTCSICPSNKVNSTTNTQSWLNQLLDPAYAWGNTQSTFSNLSPFGYWRNTASGSMASDRDYYVELPNLNNSATFNGTSGVGCGPSAGTGCTHPVAQPSTCTQGVGYWNPALNSGNGALLICGSSNNWVQSYTPYTYPHPLTNTVVMAFNAPTYGFNVLAGSTHTVNVGITNGSSNLVNWTVSATTGGASATLSASANALPVVTVTIGGTSGNCTINGALGAYSVTSTATVTIQAQSVDDNTKTASTTFNVCATSTAVTVVPPYHTLYAGQKADVQSFVVGNTNLNVAWSITAQPAGGNGTLSDTANRDTVFSATVAGRYTLTATSAADATKTATTIIYVTGNALPSYSVTPNGTVPVDCTVDPALTGTIYEVGLARAFPTIQSVPMNTMPAGSTVRIHNDGTPGNPTVYHEYFQISSQTGTAAQPLRVVGCPASNGELPIVDGQNATGASWVSPFSAAGFGIASIAGGAFGFYQTGNPGNEFVTVEGIHFRNATPSFTYTPPGGGAPVAWIDGAACINVRHGYQLAFVGNDADGCSNGVFTDNNMNSNAWAGNVLGVLWEGNHIHNSGISGSFLDHQLYLQEWLEVIQFNRIDNYTPGAQGTNFKDRSLGTIFRYNYLDQEDSSAGRQVDMVELQDSSDYESFEQYLSFPSDTNCNDSNWCLGDTMGPNVLAAWQEAYHQAFFYGNVSKNGTTEYSFHFAEDHDGGMSNRMGSLFYYSNTWNMTGPIGFDGAPIQVLFDTSGGGGNAYNNFEWPQVQAQNSIVWTPPSPGGHPYWNLMATFLGTFKTNLLATNWGNISTPILGGTPNAETGNGWSNATTQFSYPLSVPLEAHMAGISAPNFLTTGTQPFDSTTYVPPSGSAAINAGTALTGAMAVMPVRFQMRPDTGAVSSRVQPLTIGALEPGPQGMWTGWRLIANNPIIFCGQGSPLPTVCHISPGQDGPIATTTAGTIWVVKSSAAYSSAPANAHITVTGGDGTWVQCTSCFVQGPGVGTKIGYYQDVWYNLGPHAGGQTGGITVTLLSGQSPATDSINFMELMPPVGSTATFDGAVSGSGTTGCTVCTVPTLPAFTNTDMVLALQGGPSGQFCDTNPLTGNSCQTSNWFTDSDGKGFLLNAVPGAAGNQPSYYRRQSGLVAPVFSVLAFKTTLGAYTPPTPQYTVYQETVFEPANTACQTCVIPLPKPTQAGDLIFIEKWSGSAITAVTGSGSGWVIGTSSGCVLSSFHCAYNLSSTAGLNAISVVKSSNNDSYFIVYEIHDRNGGTWSLDAQGVLTDSNGFDSGYNNFGVNLSAATGGNDVAFQALQCGGGSNGPSLFPWPPPIPTNGLNPGTGPYNYISLNQAAVTLLLDTGPTIPTPIWTNCPDLIMHVAPTFATGMAFKATGGSGSTLAAPTNLTATPGYISRFILFLDPDEDYASLVQSAH
ncbi:MAG: Ig domain protein group 2 domain protein, partial [Candidatus Sulfotelmatobacter sp.]|nr:Ig domain protein group 2 domain protein [Candidatus Sulfotelmatobacter sp.]